MVHRPAAWLLALGLPLSLSSLALASLLALGACDPADPGGAPPAAPTRGAAAAGDAVTANLAFQGSCASQGEMRRATCDGTPGAQNGQTSFCSDQHDHWMAVPLNSQYGRYRGCGTCFRICAPGGACTWGYARDNSSCASSYWSTCWEGGQAIFTALGASSADGGIRDATITEMAPSFCLDASLAEPVQPGEVGRTWYPHLFPVPAAAGVDPATGAPAVAATAASGGCVARQAECANDVPFGGIACAGNLAYRCLDGCATDDAPDSGMWSNPASCGPAGCTTGTGCANGLTPPWTHTP